MVLFFVLGNQASPQNHQSQLLSQICHLQTSVQLPSGKHLGSIHTTWVARSKYLEIDEPLRMLRFERLKCGDLLSQDGNQVLQDRLDDCLCLTGL